MALPVFVVSLPHSARRRERVARALAGVDGPVQVVDAVDGATLGPLRVLTTHQPHLGRPLTPGEVGCLESHLGVLERIVAAGLEAACICEDDIQLTDDAVEVLRDLAAQPGGRGRHRWDVVLLGHHSARREYTQGAVTCWGGRPVGQGRRVARVAEFAMGAYAYVVTRRAAERLLACARPLRMPWDWVTGYAPAAGLRLCAVTPPCVTPDPQIAESAIGPRPDGPSGSRHAGSGVRRALGEVWLAARRLGLAPDGYVRRY